MSFVSQKAQYFRTLSLLKVISDLKAPEARYPSRLGALTLILKCVYANAHGPDVQTTVEELKEELALPMSGLL